MKSYNILEFGAKIGDWPVTDPIQKAIDTCFLEGGGEVIIPEGYFRTGSIRLRSGVTLHLLSGAILEGSERPEDYFGWMDDQIEPLHDLSEDPYGYKGSRSSQRYSAWNNGLIRILDAHDVAIIGEKYSYIDGRNVFDPRGEEGYRGPHGINAWNVENLTLKGYTLRNSGNWAHAVFKSRNVRAENITVWGGHDGFDAFLCQNVVIENSSFYTGDDCIAGFGSVHVTVRNCVLNSSCSAIRFGGTDVLVEDCRTVSPCEFGFRGSLSTEKKMLGSMTDQETRHNTKTAFLYYCDERFGALPCQPGGIIIKNCSFERVDQLFNMDFGRHVWCCNRPLASIQFYNCTITGVKTPIYIKGGEEAPIAFELEQVCYAAAEGYENIAFADLETFRSFSVSNTQIKGLPEPKVIVRTEGKLTSVASTPCTVEKGEPGGSGLTGH